MRRARSLAALLLACSASSPAGAGETALSTELFVAGVDRPVYVTAPAGDSSRVFILEQHSGKILIAENGTLLSAPFMTQTGLSTGDDQGLLCLAFHPDYALNGHFYLNYTRSDGATVIRRYTVSANPDIADTGSGVEILTISQPFPDHNGGWLGFGPDGYLYVPLGDGGSQGDPNNVAQSDTTRLGKVLRIDIDSGLPYSIPPNNPFVGSPSPSDEVWAKGVRNPWRCAFDSDEGDFYIADVGQNVWEEIDVQPAASAGGENYGWRLFEGPEAFNCPDPCDSSGLTSPTHAYDHGGVPFRCSIIGGYVYRGSAIPDLRGAYFFADFCSDQIWTIRVVGGTATDLDDRTAELDPPGALDVRSISSFGADGLGELYICDYNGNEVFKIIADPTGVPGSAASPGSVVDLGSPFPNPSRDRFSFRVELAGGGPSALRVYDTGGRVVRAIWDGVRSRGEHSVEWDGRNERGEAVSAGVYLLRLDAGGVARQRKLTLVR